MQVPGCALDLKDVKIANRTSLLKHFVIQWEDPNFLYNHVIYASRELCTRLRHRSMVKEEEAAAPVGGGGAFSNEPKQKILPHYNPKVLGCFLLNWQTEQTSPLLPVKMVNWTDHLFCPWKLYQKHRGLFPKEHIFEDTRKRKGNNTKQRRKQMGTYELGRAKKPELLLAVDVTVLQSPGRYTMHPTIQVKRKPGEMANNQFKRQEAPSGVFLLAILHPMSEVPPLHHSRGLHRGTRGMLGWGQEGYRYCPNNRDCVILQAGFPEPSISAVRSFLPNHCPHHYPTHSTVGQPSQVS